jgi:glycosyltransferase involved in cell wall biosynthesis
VLFVSHYASRTGAPLALWRFLRWVRENTDLDFEVALLAGGPMADDFGALARVHVVPVLDYAPVGQTEQWLRTLKRHRAADRRHGERIQEVARRLRGYDVLYLNSAVSAAALHALPEIPPITITHLHEMFGALTYWIAPPDREALLYRSHAFITCADTVSSALIGGFHVDPWKVRRHHAFIDPLPESTGSAALRERHGIPSDALVVGGVGSVNWRKGPDLFLQVAAEVVRARPDLDIRFVWAGAPGHPDEGDPPVEEDTAKLGLEGRVHFVGEFTSPADVFGMFDVFCLTSREDPFPLVMLEAAAAGVPIASFANGGVVELAAAGGDDGPLALVVDYLDVPALARVVVDLLDDANARAELGRLAREHVLAHHVTDVAAPRLYAELQALHPAFP